MPYANVDLQQWQPAPLPCLTAGRPLIIHAPTNRNVKGTDAILNGIEQLRQRNLQFDFQLLEGKSHVQAKEMLRNADILIDQLLIGWYGGVAVEFMAMAKPVLCFIRDGDLKFIPRRMRDEMPIVNVDSRNLADRLESLLRQGTSSLGALGTQSRAYVERWHNPRSIAVYVQSCYEAGRIVGEFSA